MGFLTSFPVRGSKNYQETAIFREVTGTAYKHMNQYTPMS
jgi:hypothetical protein